MATPILNTFAKRFVYEQFDASNEEHVRAYVCLKKFGRQHPTLRFYLEDPFLSVPHLMESRIADRFLSQYPTVVEEADQLIQANKGTLVSTVVASAEVSASASVLAAHRAMA